GVEHGCETPGRRRLRPGHPGGASPGPDETPCQLSATALILRITVRAPDPVGESTMRLPAPVTRFRRGAVAPPPCAGPPLALLPALGVLLLALAPAGSGADEKAPAKLTPEAVGKLEKAYREERQAAEKSGLLKKFSPEWFERAAAM